MGPLEFGYQGLPRDPETGLIYFRNRYYDPELGRFITADPKGYVDGPSMYAFEMDDPANGRDPMGTLREEQQPDPKDKVAQKVQKKYQRAYEEFKKTPKGAAAAERLEKDPNFKLTVIYMSQQPGQNEGAGVSNYKFDDKGRVISAELRIGPDFLNEIDDKTRYPKGSTLKGRGREKQVYVVGHEEQGHFMSAVDDPEYASRIRRALEVTAKWQAAYERAKAKFPNDPKAAEAERERLLGPDSLAETREVGQIHTKNEQTADAKGWEFVEDIKNEGKKKDEINKQ